MYSKKSVGPRIEPWGTSALTGYLCEDFPSKTTWSRLHKKRRNKARYPTWNSIRPKFVKKTSIINPFKSLYQVLYGYIKCSSSSSPRPVKSPSNSIRRSAVDREDLIKPRWKSESISHGGQQACYLQVFQRL